MTTAALLHIDHNTYLYERRPDGRLKKSKSIYCTRQLDGWLRDHPQLQQIALAGDEPGDAFLNVLIHRVDLVLIPETWLQHLPPRAFARRARLAIRLAQNHQREPILCRYAPLPDEMLPF